MYPPPTLSHNFLSRRRRTIASGSAFTNSPDATIGATRCGTASDGMNPSVRFRFAQHQARVLSQAAAWPAAIVLGCSG